MRMDELGTGLWLNFIPAVLAFCCSLATVLLIVVIKSNRRTFSCRLVALACVANMGVSVCFWFSPEGKNWFYTEQEEADAAHSMACLAQGMSVVFFETAQDLWVVMLIHSEYEVVLKNNKRPEVWATVYGLNVLIICLVLSLSGLGPSLDRTAYGWDFNGRCKWDMAGHNYWKYRGWTWYSIATGLQVVVCLIISRASWKIYRHLRDKYNMCIERWERDAFWCKLRQHFRFIFVCWGYVLLRVVPISSWIIDIIYFIVNCATRDCEAWDVPREIFIFNTCASTLLGIWMFLVFYSYDFTTVVGSCRQCVSYRIFCRKRGFDLEGAQPIPAVAESDIEQAELWCRRHGIGEAYESQKELEQQALLPDSTSHRRRMARNDIILADLARKRHQRPRDNDPTGLQRKNSLMESQELRDWSQDSEGSGEASNPDIDIEVKLQEKESPVGDDIARTKSTAVGHALNVVKSEVAEAAHKGAEGIKQVVKTAGGTFQHGGHDPHIAHIKVSHNKNAEILVAYRHALPLFGSKDGEIDLASKVLD